MSALWLLPLAVGAVGAVALVAANRKLTAEMQALHRSLRPLRARRQALDAGMRRGPGAP